MRDDHSHPVASALVSITGVAYFAAWSLSFYPQLIKNYRRKKTTGLSADFTIINPIGFLTLTIWNWGVYFSPLAREQYRRRHGGHSPQISKSDLAFSLHALIISTITLVQVIYYALKNGKRRKGAAMGIDEEEERPLLADPSIVDMAVPVSTIRPSLPFQLPLIAILVSSLGSAVLVWTGKAEWLDWLYFVSTLKLVISVVKYLPQVLLNFRLKSAEGLAIWVILLDLMGSVPSFAQLVISSVWIEHDPSGIVANPAKLGLSVLSMIFDVVIITQKYVLYPHRTIDNGNDE